MAQLFGFSYTVVQLQWNRIPVIQKCYESFYCELNKKQAFLTESEEQIKLQNKQKLFRI